MRVQVVRWVVGAALVAAACGAGCGSADGAASDAGLDASGGAAGSGGSGGTGATDASSEAEVDASVDAFDAAGDAGEAGDAAVEAPRCDPFCSPDFRSVLDCHGEPSVVCGATDLCDVSLAACRPACAAVVADHLSSGCEYYATNMDNYVASACFAVYVANTWSSAAHLQVEYAGQALDLAAFARIPAGSGSSMTYTPIDPVAGLAPGEVAILFLAGDASSAVPCPVAAAVPLGSQIVGQSGIGSSFHVTSDVPVAAYQMSPYGGGSAAVTGASLLLPTTAWDTTYLAVTAGPYDISSPSMNLVARDDDTRVTMTPKVAIAAGSGVAAGAAGVPYSFTLNRGQFAQFSQHDDLLGSPIVADKPIGLMAGQPCLRAPLGVAYCDHAEQMVPPVRALGSQYVGVMWRPRVAGDRAIWHLVGVAAGTQLTYSSDVGGPATLSAGQAVDFVTDTPFVVSSQDAQHPFLLFSLMSGSAWTQLSNTTGYGDADFVLGVPPAQYLSEYVFFADPSYPETNLVVVRASVDGTFRDVTLDCAGVLGGWQTVGAFQWTRVDLTTGDFQGVGACSTGRRKMTSAGAFGVWVWGWGTPDTASFTSNVSYGYPAGMNVHPINDVVLAP